MAVHSKRVANAAPARVPREAMMKLSNKLQSPAALVLQGFLVGAAVFFTLQPLSGADTAPPPAAAPSVLSDIQA
jgi:hypothetical protein